MCPESCCFHWIEASDCLVSSNPISLYFAIPLFYHFLDPFSISLTLMVIGQTYKDTIEIPSNIKKMPDLDYNRVITGPGLSHLVHKGGHFSSSVSCLEASRAAVVGPVCLSSAGKIEIEK